MDWARDNVIGLIEPPLQLRGGPDVIALADADGGAGLTILIQNPYEVAMTFAVGVRDKEAVSSEDDAVWVEMTPLEIGALVVPLDVEPHRDVEVRLGGGPRGGHERVRPTVAGQLNRGETLMGVLGGLGQAFVFGFGRLRFVRTGGEVDNPFQTTLEFKRPRSGSATVQYQRLWAQPGAGPAEMLSRRHQGAKWWSSRAIFVGFAFAFAAAFVATATGSLIHGRADGVLLWYFLLGLPAGWFLAWRILGRFGWMHTRYKSLLPPDPPVAGLHERTTADR